MRAARAGPDRCRAVEARLPRPKSARPALTGRGSILTSIHLRSKRSQPEIPARPQGLDPCAVPRSSSRLQSSPYTRLCLALCCKPGLSHHAFHRQGLNPYVVPVGGSSPLGVWGYLEATKEIAEQIKGQGFTDIAMVRGQQEQPAPLAAVLPSWRWVPILGN